MPKSTWIGMWINYTKETWYELMRAKTQGVRKERLGLEVEPFDSFLSCPFVLNSPPIQRHKACIAVAMFVLTSHRDEIISSTNDP